MRNWVASIAAVGKLVSVEGESYEVDRRAAARLRLSAEDEYMVRIACRAIGKRKPRLLQLPSGRVAAGWDHDRAGAASARCPFRPAGEAISHRRGHKLFRAVPLRDALTGGVRTSLWLWLAAVGVLLLIACANVAHLQLVRISAQGHALAVRSALGATRARIVSAVLLEAARRVVSRRHCRASVLHSRDQAADAYAGVATATRHERQPRSAAARLLSAAGRARHCAQRDAAVLVGRATRSCGGTEPWHALRQYRPQLCHVAARAARGRNCAELPARHNLRPAAAHDRAHPRGATRLCRRQPAGGLRGCAGPWTCGAAEAALRSWRAYDSTGRSARR